MPWISPTSDNKWQSKKSTLRNRTVEDLTSEFEDIQNKSLHTTLIFKDISKHIKEKILDNTKNVFTH